MDPAVIATQATGERTSEYMPTSIPVPTFGCEFAVTHTETILRETLGSNVIEKALDYTRIGLT